MKKAIYRMSMKMVIIILLFGFFSVSYALEDQPAKNAVHPIDSAQLIKQIKRVDFANEKFLSTWSSDSPTQLTTEYSLRGEKLDYKKWKELFEINIYKNQTVDPLHFAVTTGKIMQSYNPGAPYAIFLCNDKLNSSDVTLDFLTWQVDKSTGDVQFTEFNVFRFFYSADKNNIVGIHYVRRFYISDSNEDIRNWMKNNRMKMVDWFWKKNIPVYNKESKQIADFAAPVCKHLGYFTDDQIK